MDVTEILDPDAATVACRQLALEICSKVPTDTLTEDELVQLTKLPKVLKIDEFGSISGPEEAMLMAKALEFGSTTVPKVRFLSRLSEHILNDVNDTMSRLITGLRSGQRITLTII